MSSSGLPLLSGPPPDNNLNEQSCRKCDKEFNLLFARSRRCNHCGYSYCHSCSDYNALMPRGGESAGHDVVPVCAFCIENLTITALSKDQLKQQPLSKLRKYASAYSIKIDDAVEKDDIINALISAKGPNGCLAPKHEQYYRRCGVPDRSSSRPRGFFTRAMDAMNTSTSSSSSAPETPPQEQQSRSSPYSYQPRQRTTSGPGRPRPDFYQQNTRSQPRAPPPQAQNQYPPRGPYPPYPPHPQYHTPPPNPPRPAPSRPAQTRGRAASAGTPPVARDPTPAPAVPTLEELLDTPDERLAALSIGTLKQVLLQNHVNARLVVEKDELVAKVRALVADERAERERRAAEEEDAGGWEEDEEERVLAEVLERSRREAEEREEEERAARGEGQEHVEEMHVDEDPLGVGRSAETSEDHANPPAAPPTSDDAASSGAEQRKSATPLPVPKGSASSKLSPGAQAAANKLERTGLCVICQDEEANIAIVDCGHLALCRACSELIMKSSRECPLCRTRIVTEQRLLRIFKA